MPICQIAPVERQGMKLLIALFGLSESGKTYSALRLACGIEPDPKKRGLLDTEGGQRGRAYMDAIPGGYMYGALTPPFTPERYAEAMNDFVAAGVTTLVIDSVSHAWFSTGGVLDMVESAPEKNDMAKWAKPKRRLGKLTAQLLQSGLHLILCSRAKQPMVEGPPGRNGKPTLIPGPVTPIQEKTLRYDMTIMAQMLGDGRFSIAKEHGGKCPGSMRHVFQTADGNGVMDENMGRRLMEWIGGHDSTTAAQRALRIEADARAGMGAEHFRGWWTSLSQQDREYLKPSIGNLKSIAADADAAAAAGQGDEPDTTPPAGPALDGGVTPPPESVADTDAWVAAYDAVEEGAK